MAGSDDSCAAVGTFTPGASLSLSRRASLSLSHSVDCTVDGPHGTCSLVLSLSLLTAAGRRVGGPWPGGAIQSASVSSLILLRLMIGR